MPKATCRVGKLREIRLSQEYCSCLLKVGKRQQSGEISLESQEGGRQELDNNKILHQPKSFELVCEVQRALLAFRRLDICL